MAGRKTDFNTEDIMGSLLGMKDPVLQPSVHDPHPSEEKTASVSSGKKKEKEKKVPVSFSMTRSMAEDLKRIAYVDRITCSEIICDLVQRYIREHQASLREYDRIIRK